MTTSLITAMKTTESTLVVSSTMRRIIFSWYLWFVSRPLSKATVVVDAFAAVPPPSSILRGAAADPDSCFFTGFDDHPQLDAFARGDAPLVCLHNVANIKILNAKDILFDAMALFSAGFGNRNVGVMVHNGRNTSSAGTTIRSKVDQIWLQTPYSSTPLLKDTYVGQVEARQSLYRFVEILRRKLDSYDYFSLPHNQVELSYLLYHVGAYYGKHIDVARGSNKTHGASHRVVSFLLYLGKPNQQERWDKELDGGCLRVYHGTYNASSVGTGQAALLQEDEEHSTTPTSYLDIVPNVGTLVLFDSQSVPHEVLTTYSPRACVAGWFRSSSPP